MDRFTERFNEVLRYEPINQSQLATTIGISRQCISDYKSGKSYPTIQTLSLICQTLEVSSDYLLGLEDDFGARTVAPMHASSPSSVEQKLLDVYRTLDDDMKATLWSLLDTWKPTLHVDGSKKPVK